MKTWRLKKGWETPFSKVEACTLVRNPSVEMWSPEGAKFGEANCFAVTEECMQSLPEWFEEVKEPTFRLSVTYNGKESDIKDLPAFAMEYFFKDFWERSCADRGITQITIQ